jgi:hypothetical protein
MGIPLLRVCPRSGDGLLVDYQRALYIFHIDVSSGVYTNDLCCGIMFSSCQKIEDTILTLLAILTEGQCGHMGPNF